MTEPASLPLLQPQATEATSLTEVHPCTYLCIAADHGDAICPIGRCLVDEGDYTVSPVEARPPSILPPLSDEDDEEQDEEP